MKLILSFLLHHANRSAKMYMFDSVIQSFYAIKDKILSKYGFTIGYDVQHIPGKKCRSCGGTGSHPRYSNRPPYNVYDWNDCYHCCAGWYKYPQWICLSRIKFGRYIFHKPLKKELRVKNPFTITECGWDVTQNPVISGYIEHNESKIGRYAYMILMFFYDRKTFRIIYDKFIRYEVKPKFRIRITIRSFMVIKPKSHFIPIYTPEENDDLPF